MTQRVALGIRIWHNSQVEGAPGFRDPGFLISWILNTCHNPQGW